MTDTFDRVYAALNARKRKTVEQISAEVDLPVEKVVNALKWLVHHHMILVEKHPGGPVYRRTPLTSTERSHRLRERADAESLVRRQYYATVEDHKKLKTYLEKIRK